MNKKILKILICYIMILLLFSNSTLIKSIALDEVQFYVAYSYQLKNAIEQANDNDIIGITDSISADELSIIGTNEKHITLKRMNANASIYLGTGSYTITNITFDGNNIPSSRSFVESVQNTTLSNCIFKNCISTWEGSCINAMDKKIYITNCSFVNNQAIYGGHIACNGGEYVEIKNSLLSNGSAQIGGAIYSNADLTVENTKFYNNTASTGGSDIYCIGNLNLKDSIEDLQKLFPDSELKPIAWISDYNDDNSYLKLEFGKIDEEKDEEPNQDDNNKDDDTTNETDENQNNDNTENENNKGNEGTENNQQEENNINTENTEPNTQEENNKEPEPQNTSNEENENNNSEPNQENTSAPTSNENTNNETVTNTSHNEANDNTSNSNTNTDESSFIQKIIDKITETFNIQNPTTQQITDDSSKSITNSNESPVNQKIYITASPSNNSDYKTESSNIIPENSDSSNQTYNFSFDFKNDTYRNNDLLIILIFIQTILIAAILIILILKNKQNNKYHHYKSKKHVRKH